MRPGPGGEKHFGTDLTRRQRGGTDKLLLEGTPATAGFRYLPRRKEKKKHAAKEDADVDQGYWFGPEVEGGWGG